MALTTTALVKSYAGITVSTHDTLLDAIVAGVDRAVKAYLGRQIESGAVSNEVHDGNGRDDFLLLREFPVSAVSSVTLNGTALASSDYEIDGDGGAIVYKPGGISFAAWPEGRRNIVVSYTAGYASVPADLAHQATLQAWYEARLTIAGGGSGRLGDRSTILQDGGVAQYVIPGAGGWYPGVQEKLDAYRVPRCR